MKRNLTKLLNLLAQDTAENLKSTLRAIDNGNYNKEKPSLIKGVRGWEKKTKTEKKKLTRQAYAETLATRKAELLDLYENGEDFAEFVARVNWHRSATWGYNPTAETWAGWNTYGQGSASGCGYDKLSASICSSLSEQAEKNIKIAIIRAFVKNGQPKNETARPLPYGVRVSLYAFGGVSLDFGGCGESAIRGIFTYCGFTDYRYISGEMFDYIEARKPQPKSKGKR